MYSRSDEVGDSKYLNVDWAVNYWLQHGMPRNKLVLGMPTYGRGFILDRSEDVNRLGADASSGGYAGPVNFFINFIGYLKLLFNVCQKIFSPCIYQL